jgi:cell division protein FtsB
VGRRVLRMLLLLVAVVVLIDALFGDKGLVAALKVRRQREDLRAAVAAVRDENGRLRAEARRLREDPKAVEDVARRDLGLIRPGELVFIVKDGPAAPLLSGPGRPGRRR